MPVRLARQPKLDYLEDALNLNTDELRAAVLRMPAILGYSLERRYRPRAERCCRAGAPLRRVLEGITLSDARFNASVPLPDGECDLGQ